VRSRSRNASMLRAPRPARSAALNASEASSLTRGATRPIVAARSQPSTRGVGLADRRRYAQVTPRPRSG
jgi:hypothetical protein